MDIQNRIIGLRYVKASELTPNEHNWRKHPKQQTDALKGVLNQVGWVGAALYNVTTGRMLDGHLRRDVAGDAEIPVLDVELSEDEERLVLLSLDPIAAMAEANADKLKILMEMIVSNEAVSQMLDQLAQSAGVVPHFEPAPMPPRLDEKKKVLCPHCGCEFTP